MPQKKLQSVNDMDFKGISAESMLLLSENRFKDSREFYEEHKEEIKSVVTVPLRQIAGIIGERLVSLDPMIVSNPIKMVSRVCRDTRFTHDKHLYRENMWIMFMRDKHIWHQYPCMWFEVFPGRFTTGVGMFMEKPALMEYYRAAIRERTADFVAAVKSVEASGAVLSGEEYKKPKPGCPEGLERYYSIKNMYFMKTNHDFARLANPNVIDEIWSFYQAASPMYSFLLSIADKFASDNLAVKTEDMR